MTDRTRTILLASRDLVTGEVVNCGSRTEGQGAWSVHYTHKAGHGNPFLAGRLRKPRGPNEAPRSYRPPR